MLVQLSPNQKASQRTKNRIKENGPTFRFIKESLSCDAFNNRPAKLFHSPATDWLGWIPSDEIEM